MTTEEKLLQGLKLVIEAFAEMTCKPVNQQSPIIVKDERDQTFKPAEAAKYLQVSEWFIRDMAKKGEIEHFRVGNRYLFRKSTLDKWIIARQQQSIRKEETNTDGYGRLRKVKE